MTAVLSFLLVFNWPAEPVSLWEEAHALICDQCMAEL